MPRGYDMLVVDLDGTLLDREGRVSVRNEAALRDARADGMVVSVATGRAPSEARSILRGIGYSGPLIAAGGAQLVDAATGRTLRRDPITLDVVHDVAARLIEHRHRALVLKDECRTGYHYLLAGSDALHPVSAWWFDAHAIITHEVDSIVEDPHPDDSLRVGAVAHGDELARVVRLMLDELGDRALLRHWSAVTPDAATGSPTHLLEVFHPQVNKWTMIERVAADHGIAPARIAAIGDEINDVEMIRHAGLGIAMANAAAPIRAMAARVTASHVEDGVALAVERILTGEW